MLTHNNQEPVISFKEPLHHGQYKQLYNPYLKKMPEIISFTQFLRWNYTIDYGQYIRHLHYNGQLPLSWGILPYSDITNVTILDGKYDRIDEFSFNMHVICNITFFSNGYEYQQSYYVNGYYSITGKSNFLCSVDIYNGKHIRRINPLDVLSIGMYGAWRYVFCSYGGQGRMGHYSELCLYFSCQ